MAMYLLGSVRQYSRLLKERIIRFHEGTYFWHEGISPYIGDMLFLWLPMAQYEHLTLCK